MCLALHGLLVLHAFYPPHSLPFPVQVENIQVENNSSIESVNVVTCCSVRRRKSRKNRKPPLDKRRIDIVVHPTYNNHRKRNWSPTPSSSSNASRVARRACCVLPDSKHGSLDSEEDGFFTNLAAISHFCPEHNAKRKEDSVTQGFSVDDEARLTQTRDASRGAPPRVPVFPDLESVRLAYSSGNGWISDHSLQEHARQSASQLEERASGVLDQNEVGAHAEPGCDDASPYDSLEDVGVVYCPSPDRPKSPLDQNLHSNEAPLNYSSADSSRDEQSISQLDSPRAERDYSPWHEQQRFHSNQSLGEQEQDSSTPVVSSGNSSPAPDNDARSDGFSTDKSARRLSILKKFHSDNHELDVDGSSSDMRRDSHHSHVQFKKEVRKVDIVTDGESEARVSESVIEIKDSPPANARIAWQTASKARAKKTSKSKRKKLRETKSPPPRPSRPPCPGDVDSDEISDAQRLGGSFATQETAASESFPDMRHFQSLSPTPQPKSQSHPEFLLCDRQRASESDNSEEREEIVISEKASLSDLLLAILRDLRSWAEDSNDEVKAILDETIRKCEARKARSKPVRQLRIPPELRTLISGASAHAVDGIHANDTHQVAQVLAAILRVSSPESGYDADSDEPEAMAATATATTAAAVETESSSPELDPASSMTVEVSEGMSHDSRSEGASQDSRSQLGFTRLDPTQLPGDPDSSSERLERILHWKQDPARGNPDVCRTESSGSSYVTGSEVELHVCSEETKCVQGPITNKRIERVLLAEKHDNDGFAFDPKRDIFPTVKPPSPISYERNNRSPEDSSTSSRERPIESKKKDSRVQFNDDVLRMDILTEDDRVAQVATSVVSIRDAEDAGPLERRSPTCDTNLLEHALDSVLRRLCEDPAALATIQQAEPIVCTLLNKLRERRSEEARRNQRTAVVRSDVTPIEETDDRDGRQKGRGVCRDSALVSSSMPTIKLTDRISDENNVRPERASLEHISEDDSGKLGSGSVDRVRMDEELPPSTRLGWAGARASAGRYGPDPARCTLFELLEKFQEWERERVSRVSSTSSSSSGGSAKSGSSDDVTPTENEAATTTAAEQKSSDATAAEVSEETRSSEQQLLSASSSEPTGLAQRISPTASCNATSSDGALLETPPDASEPALDNPAVSLDSAESAPSFIPLQTICINNDEEEEEEEEESEESESFSSSDSLPYTPLQTIYINTEEEDNEAEETSDDEEDLVDETPKEANEDQTCRESARDSSGATRTEEPGLQQAPNDGPTSDSNGETAAGAAETEAPLDLLRTFLSDHSLDSSMISWILQHNSTETLQKDYSAWKEKIKKGAKNGANGGGSLDHGLCTCNILRRKLTGSGGSGQSQTLTGSLPIFNKLVEVMKSRETKSADDVASRVAMSELFTRLLFLETLDADCGDLNGQMPDGMDLSESTEESSSSDDATEEPGTQDEAQTEEASAASDAQGEETATDAAAETPPGHLDTEAVRAVLDAAGLLPGVLKAVDCLNSIFQSQRETEEQTSNSSEKRDEEAETDNTETASADRQKPQVAPDNETSEGELISDKSESEEEKGQLQGTTAPKDLDDSWVVIHKSEIPDSVTESEETGPEETDASWEETNSSSEESIERERKGAGRKRSGHQGAEQPGNLGEPKVLVASVRTQSGRALLQTTFVGNVGEAGSTSQVL